MKVNIDEKICLKSKLTLTEVLIALAVRNGTDFEETVNNMIAREILVNKEGKILITQRWNDVVDEILCDSMGSIDDEERLLALAKKMRECFPEGKMPGTAYYYRCNNREVILKLKKFFTQYGNYSDEEIIDATKRFVASYQGNYRFMPLIKYFISKNKTVTDEDGTNHITEVSELASYLENKGEGVGGVTNSDEWLMNSRN